MLSLFPTVFRPPIHNRKRYKQHENLYMGEKKKKIKKINGVMSVIKINSGFNARHFILLK